MQGSNPVMHIKKVVMQGSNLVMQGSNPVMQIKKVVMQGPTLWKLMPGPKLVDGFRITFYIDFLLYFL
jgi:hypothetical protein